MVEEENGETIANRERKDFSMRRYSRDLLSQESIEDRDFDEEEEIELNLDLGLSLGGKFGVDKTTSKKLIRSSSISGSMPLIKDRYELESSNIQYPILMRASSLPTETEDERRKRKEIQTLRRFEAKKKKIQKERRGLSISKTDDGLASWPVVAKQVVAAADAEPEELGGLFPGRVQLGSRGSVESQGGSSSGLTEFESKSLQGSSSSFSEATGSSQSMQERSNQEGAGSSGTKKDGNIYRTSSLDTGKSSRKSAENQSEIGRNAIEDMPCVFTRGDGPNGRRIEGILYKYGKGEEVRIMCVCHGSFLSPAEFVTHAGGTDVDHPLRHIVVSPSTSLFP